MADLTAENSNPGGFKKGDPRINREGRPKGSISIVSALKRKLEEVPEGKTKTYMEYLVDQVMKKTVIEGDVTMMKDIINRVDGMPQQRTDVTSGNKPLGILHGIISSNNSDKESDGNEEEDKSNTGGNECEQDSIDSLIPDPSSTGGQDTNPN